MGFASGPISYRRFFIDGAMPSNVDDSFLAALTSRAFGRVAPLADDSQAGWIGPRHVLDTDLRAEEMNFGQFAYLALRLDRLRPPSAVVKAYVRQEEQAALEASGREFLSKGERKKAREAANERLEQEMRDGAFRRMGMYPVLLDPTNRVAYLSSTSSGLADKFMTLFHHTFQAALVPADVPAVAQRIATARKRIRALDQLTPMKLVRPPQGADDAEPDAGDVSFLGREWLTWLLHHAAEDEAVLLHGGQAATVAPERVLRYKCAYGVTGSMLLSAEQPAGLPEARAALRIGKLPTRAGLLIGSRLGELRLTLDAEAFSVSGMVVPDPADVKDRRAVLEGRFEHVADAANLLDALFEAFLLERMGEQWPARQRQMAAWAAGKPAGELRVAGAD